MKGLIAAFLAVVLGFGVVLRADVWDFSTDNDNSTTTDNEMTHGLNQVHDLVAQSGGTVSDFDFYLVTAASRASYEAVVDGQTGDVNISAGNFVRTAADGNTVLQTSSPADLGGSTRSITFENTGVSSTTNYIVVGAGACTTTCTTTDQYRMRYYETTVAVPRFNNAGSQVTVLFIQNTGNTTVNGNIYFWSAAGALIASSPFSAGAKDLVVLQTATVTGATSGSITISNTGRYGVLAVKTVALEPATGFSFDTPGSYRPL